MLQGQGGILWCTLIQPIREQTAQTFYIGQKAQTSLSLKTFLFSCLQSSVCTDKANLACPPKWPFSGDLFFEPPLISFRRACNSKDCLVHSYLSKPLLASWRQNSLSTYALGRNLKFSCLLTAVALMSFTFEMSQQSGVCLPNKTCSKSEPNTRPPFILRIWTVRQHVIKKDRFIHYIYIWVEWGNHSNKSKKRRSRKQIKCIQIY